MKIYDGDRLIRTLKRKAPKKSGVHKWTWYMDEKGTDRPSRRIRKRTREPGGVDVKPGNYKVEMSFGDQTSETMITVANDPRISINTSSQNEVYATSKDIEKMRQTAADAVKQLVESKTIADDYKKMLGKLDKKAYKDQIKASKEISEKIDEIIAIYLGKVDKRQGITRNPDPNVNQRIGNASFYVGTRKNGITSTERDLMKHAENALNDALGKTNAFFAEEWEKYRADMEQLEISPFKDTKTFSND